MASGIRLTSYNPDEVNNLVADHVLELTIATLEEARRTCPVGASGDGRSPGRLRRSLDADVDQRGTTITGRVFTDLEYAIYVHEGRGPVVARPGKVLGPLPNPYPRFVRRVRAARGNPWLLEALKTVSPYPVREGRG